MFNAINQGDNGYEITGKKRKRLPKRKLINRITLHTEFFSGHFAIKLNVTMRSYRWLC